MDAGSLLQQQASWAHAWLDGTLGDITSEQVHWLSPNGSNVGAQYAHIVSSEDFLINVVAKGGAPLAATAWAGKTGLSEPMPRGAFDEWAQRVRIDIPALREYGNAVFANTEEYIASLSSEELDRPLDLTDWGLGKISLGIFIGGLVLGNTYCHCGEMSCIKGLQGLKGYPR
jgi:hypothetical protein